jgi:hypothetical protein
MGKIVHARCADAVGATLIFLNLLEGQADGFAKTFLGQPKKSATQAHATADMDVDRIGDTGDASASYFADRVGAATI